MSMSENMNFTVYSKDGCPYCSKVVQVLELTGLKHVVYKLGEDFDRKSFYDEFGDGATFPQVLLNADKLGGCIDTVKYLRENNII